MRVMRLIAASYNVHGCVGLDRVRSPERIAAVLEELDADIVALQEVSAPETLKRLLKHELLFAETMPGYGNAILSRFPMKHIVALDLSVNKREPRGALHVEITTEAGTFQVIAAHLGLALGERRHQMGEIMRYAKALTPLIVLGDFNEWLPLGLRALDAAFGKSVARRTFPSHMPLLPLDRIWLRGFDKPASFHAHKSKLARMASDHLPLRMEL